MDAMDLAPDPIDGCSPAAVFQAGVVADDVRLAKKKTGGMVSSQKMSGYGMTDI